MKSTTGNKIKLGIFVSAAIAFFTIAIYFIGQKQRLFAHTFRVRVIYKNIEGLQRGNNVRFAGINVGNVESVKIISDTAVEVDLMLDKSVRKFMRKDARAAVGSEGLMGDKLVLIIPGNGSEKEIENNDYIQATDGNSMDAIMGQIKITAQNAAQITTDLSDIVSNIHSGKGAVGKLFMDSTFAQNLNETIINAKEGVGGFKENMDAMQHNFLLRGYFKKKEKEQKEHQRDKADSLKKASR